MKNKVMVSNLYLFLLETHWTDSVQFSFRYAWYVDESNNNNKNERKKFLYRISFS